MLSSPPKKLEKKWSMDFILMAAVTSWHPWAFSQPTFCKSRFMKIFFIVLVILVSYLQSFIIVNTLLFWSLSPSSCLLSQQAGVVSGWQGGGWWQPSYACPEHQPCQLALNVTPTPHKCHCHCQCSWFLSTSWRLCSTLSHLRCWNSRKIRMVHEANLTWLHSVR